MNFSMSLSTLIVVTAACSAAAGAGIWVLLRGRRKKSDSEKERERRVAVNAIGRITDGTLMEALNSRDDPQKTLLLFYGYSVAGVEYSAAQDLSDLRDAIGTGNYGAGESVGVKYHPQNPSNSIVVCEKWSGLRAGGEAGARRQNKSHFVAGS